MKDWFTRSYKTIALISLFFLLTMAVIFFNCYYHYKNIKHIELGSDKTTANVLQSLLSEHQRAAIALLQSYANRPLLMIDVKEKNKEKILFHFEQLKNNHEEIDWLFITDSKSVLWANYPIDTVVYGKDLSHRDWYKGVRKEWKPYISTLFKLIVGDKDLGVALCVPVFDQKGQVIGILGNTQRVFFLSAIIKQVPFDQYVKVTLIDQAGQIVYSNAYTVAKEVVIYPFLSQIKKAVLEQKDVYEIDDPERANRKNYVTISSLKDFGWTIIIERADKDILLSGLSYYIQTTVIVILLFIVIVISFFYITHKQAELALQRSHDELEHRVQERTAELENINERMKREIAERKQAEKSLRESEDKFKHVFDYSAIGKSITYISGEMQANTAFYEMLGYSQDEFRSFKWQDVTHPDDVELSQKVIDSILYGEKNSKQFVKRYLHKDGSLVWADISTTLRRDKEGNPLYLMATINNITEQRKAEEILKKSEKKYRSLFENMLNGYAYCKLIFDEDKPIDFIYIDVNSAFERLTGLRNVVGKKVSEVIPNIGETDRELFDIFGRVSLTGIAETFELYLESLSMWFSISVYRPGKGYFVAIFDVITERKQAEEKIKSSLKEKEVLLSEIHHRVKNNMQVITSLLKLQADKIEDKKYADMLQESQNRIRSMALIHEQLYQSKDFANIDFGEYIKSLGDELFVSHGVDTNQIKLNIDIKDVSFDLENAIPCGLIINELVSNSLKHAFPDTRKGEIKISLHTINEVELELTVSDDGVGIPEDLDIRDAESMGLHIVRILAEQTLEGKMDLDRTEGTQFHFLLKRSKYKPRI